MEENNRNKRYKMNTQCRVFFWLTFPNEAFDYFELKNEVKQKI
jgi:hypothetical protein